MTGTPRRWIARRPGGALLGTVGLALMAAGCAAGDGGGTEGSTSMSPTTASGSGQPSAEQRYPDILQVDLEPAGANTFDVAVTVSSPYDTPERYADGWRVLAPDGTVLGEHTLTHDHAGEQPFVRTQSGLVIPAGIDRVTVEGRDQRYGFGGRTQTVTVPGR
jgi:hypothetical protein